VTTLKGTGNFQGDIRESDSLIQLEAIAVRNSGGKPNAIPEAKVNSSRGAATLTFVIVEQVFGIFKRGCLQ
jgi:hypothetical protein